jgi:hypothetical protein
VVTPVAYYELAYEEVQRTQWSKEKVQKDKQRSTTGFAARLKQRMSLMEQELLTLPKHLS